MEFCNKTHKERFTKDLDSICKLDPANIESYDCYFKAATEKNIP